VSSLGIGATFVVMGELNGFSGSGLDIMASLETRRGGYILAIAMAFVLPALRLVLDGLVFGVGASSPAQYGKMPCNLTSLCQYD
jgi:ABC-type tungstate transport system substrate-binding protein